MATIVDRFPGPQRLPQGDHSLHGRLLPAAIVSFHGGVPIDTINGWITKRLLVPAVVGKRGRGHPHLLSWKQAVAITRIYSYQKHVGTLRKEEIKSLFKWLESQSECYYKAVYLSIVEGDDAAKMAAADGDYHSEEVLYTLGLHRPPEAELDDESKRRKDEACQDTNRRFLSIIEAYGLFGNTAAAK